MINWLRRLLGGQPSCPTCEVLKEQLTHERFEKERLLKYILEPKSAMEPAIPIEQEQPETIQPRIIPWHVRKQMLEIEDRKKVELLRQSQAERQQAIEELEDRLKIKPLDLGAENVQSRPIEADIRTNQQEEVKTRN